MAEMTEEWTTAIGAAVAAISRKEDLDECDVVPNVELRVRKDKAEVQVRKEGWEDFGRTHSGMLDEATCLLEGGRLGIESERSRRTVAEARRLATVDPTYIFVCCQPRSPYPSHRSHSHRRPVPPSPVVQDLELNNQSMDTSKHSCLHSARMAPQPSFALRQRGGGCGPSKPTRSGSLATGTASVKHADEKDVTLQMGRPPSKQIQGEVPAHGGNDGVLDMAPVAPTPLGGASTALSSTRPPIADHSKFASELPTMVFGKESAYRDGLLERTGNPTRSVRQEFALNDNRRWLRDFEYVALHSAVENYNDSKGPAPSFEEQPAYTRDLGHHGKRLDDFWREQPAQLRETREELSRAEIAVLRLYTGPWFKAVNFYLRYLPVAECCTSTPYHVDEAENADGSHAAYDVRRFYLDGTNETVPCRRCNKKRSEHHCQPIDNWATSAALLYRGIDKLASVTRNATVYRGIKENHVRLPDDFVQPTDASRGFAGGVELGAMSTTVDEKVALSYMREKGIDVDCALFEIQFATYSCGADLSFLSQYPAEHEFLFPPGTSLTFRSKEMLKPGRRKLILDAQFHPDTKLRELLKPIKSLDYQPHDPLRDLLQPLTFEAELKDYGSRFVPGTRQWVFDAIDKWLADHETSRCRVLLGGPGFGKTAIVAQLCATRPDAVVGVHLCRHNDNGKRDPRRMVCTLAHQLAQALPDYRTTLELKTEQLAKEVDSMTLPELVDRLLVQPLQAIPPLASHRVLVVDALDEAEHDKKNELLRLIKTEIPRLPAWLKVLLTGRPEVPIKEALRILQPEELDAVDYAEDCERDVRIFLHSILRDRIAPDNLEKAVTKVAQKAERNFLYLYWVRKRLDEHKHAIDIEALPDGLADEYNMQMSRFYPGGFPVDTSNVLRAIVAAEEPLHMDALPGLSGVDDSIDVLDTLSLLFPVRDDDCVHVFHKSIVDWLTASPPYEDRKRRARQKGFHFVDRAEGHRMLAAACAANVSSNASNSSSNPATVYATRWALHHCAAAADWDTFARLATDLAHLDTRFAAESGAALGLDLGLARGRTDRSSSIEPFERLVLKEMPVLLRNAGAIFQLACQQPNASPVFRAWEALKPAGRRHTVWKNKPEQVDACLLTISCGGSVKGFAHLAGERYVVAANKAIEVRDARNGELLETLSEGGSDVACVAACATWICAGFNDGTIKVWDAGAKSASNRPSLAKSDHFCLPWQVHSS